MEIIKLDKLTILPGREHVFLWAPAQPFRLTDVKLTHKIPLLMIRRVMVGVRICLAFTDHPAAEANMNIEVWVKNYSRKEQWTACDLYGMYL